MSEPDVNEHQRWMPRLSEVVDGTLEGEERVAAEAHVAGCGECRAVVDDLRDLRARARALGEIPPGRDLWPGIEAGLARGPSEETPVLPLPVSGGASRRPGLFLSLPQVAAAAAVLVLTSSLLTWWATPGDAGTAVPGVRPTSGAVQAASSDPDAPPELARELEALTRLVEEGEARLDPETRRILEKNLAVVERAIEESRQALAVDPANAFLQEHLDRAWERKRAYLQEAAGIVEWASS